MLLVPVCRRGEEDVLFRRLRRDRDPAVRNALVERYMPLARHLARRYPSRGERDDVLQIAALGLVKAVDRYDPERGIAFTSFATPTILGEIKRYYRDHGWTVRVSRPLQELSVKVARVTEALTARLGRAPTAAELAEALGVGIEQVLEALASATAHRPVPLDRPSRDRDDDPRALVAVDEQGFARVEDAVAVDSLLDRLPAFERLVVTLRFREDLLLREIAQLLGTSQMQISRTLTKAITTLQSLTEELEAA
jgi:RNA polymerase sigma-B factor